MSGNSSDLTFPRTPLPSAPASSSISKIQIALNNLFSQITEAIYFVTETAPPERFSDKLFTEDEQKQKDATNKEILTRASHIASIIRTIEQMSNELPDSSRSLEYYYEKINDIQIQNVNITKKLINTCSKAEELNNILKENIRNLSADLISSMQTT